MCSQPGITTFKWVFIQNREKCTLQSVQSVNLNVFKWTVCLPVGNSKELLFFVLFWEDSVEHRPFPLFVLCSMQGLFGPLGWPVTCLKLAQEPRCTGRGKMTSLESCDKYMVRKCKSVRRGERDTQSDKSNLNEAALFIPFPGNPVSVWWAPLSPRINLSPPDGSFSFALVLLPKEAPHIPYSNSHLFLAFCFVNLSTSLSTPHPRILSALLYLQVPNLQR